MPNLAPAVPRARLALRVVRGLSTASLLALACTHGGARGATAPGSTEVLRADEISRSGATDAYQAIRILRPAFLQTRGRTSMLRSEETEPGVYVDDKPFGNIATLRDIPAREIVDVRFLGPAQAQMRFGAGNSAGVILIRTGSPKP